MFVMILAVIVGILTQIVWPIWYTIMFIQQIGTASTCYKIYAWFCILRMYTECCRPQQISPYASWILIHNYTISVWLCQLAVWFLVSDDDQCGSYEDSYFLFFTWWLFKIFFYLMTFLFIVLRYGYYQAQRAGSNTNLFFLRARAQSSFYRFRNNGLTQEQIALIPKVAYSYNQYSSQTVCVICRVDFNPGEWLYELPQCKHLFHQECISEWLKQNKTCPTDRSTVEIHQLQQYRPPAMVV